MNGDGCPRGIVVMVVLWCRHAVVTLFTIWLCCGWSHTPAANAGIKTVVMRNETSPYLTAAMALPRHVLHRLIAVPAHSPALRRTPVLTRLPQYRTLHSTPTAPATALPFSFISDPPEAPLPQSRAPQKAAAGGSKRFWKEVHVVETDGASPGPPPPTIKH